MSELQKYQDLQVRVKEKVAADLADHDAEAGAVGDRLAAGSENQKMFIRNLVRQQFHNAMKADSAAAASGAAVRHYVLSHAPAPAGREQVSDLIDALKAGTPGDILERYVAPHHGGEAAADAMEGHAAAFGRLAAAGFGRQAGDEADSWAQNQNGLSAFRAILRNAKAGAP